jgi:ABC-type sugar transport system permease subunit
MEGLEITDAHLHNVGWAVGTVVFIVVSSIFVGLMARGIGWLSRVSLSEQKKMFWGFTFAGPWIVGFVIFVVGPALASLLYSFTSYSLGDQLVFITDNFRAGNLDDFWIALDNYRALLLETDIGTGRIFKQALFNSFYYTLIGVPLQIIAALGMAMLLNRNWPGIKVFRTIYYLPVILAASPAALLAWRYMFASNGGFVNISLRWFAEKLFIFDWLYKHWIYLVEGFNGFYSGVAIGQPVGALKFTLPAILGVLALLMLAGEWTQSKKQRAYQFAEILTIVVLAMTLPTGILKTQVNLSWTFIATIIIVGFATINHVQGKKRLSQIWLFGGLMLFGVSLFRTLSGSDVSNPDTSKYVIGLVIAVAPILVAVIGTWSTRKYQMLTGALGIMMLIVVVRAIPPNFGDGGWKPLVKYATFNSTVDSRLSEDKSEISTLVSNLEQDEELSDRQKKNQIADKVAVIYDYWKVDYNNSLFSAYWIYGLLIAVLLSLWILDDKYPVARKYLLGGSLAFLVLFGLSTYLDGRAYFNGFEEIEETAFVEGVTLPKDISHYHFVTFRERTEQLPSDVRVPQWLDNELWTKPSLVLITMWSSGASMLIFLAALKGVPGTLYEAAEVDGANALQKFFKITLPMISPAMFYNIVIGVIAALQTFEAIYIIRDPTGKNDASLRSAAYFLYTRTFNDQAIGQGAAASWILAAIIVTLTILQFRYSRWVNYEV